MNKVVFSFAPAVITLVCVLLAILITLRANAGPFVAISGDSQNHTDCLARSADLANAYWDFLVDEHHPQDFTNAERAHEENLSNIEAVYNLSLALAAPLLVADPPLGLVAIAAAWAARRLERANENNRYATEVDVTLPEMHNTELSNVRLSFYKRNVNCAKAEAGRQAWDMDPYAIDQLLPQFSFSLYGHVFFEPKPEGTVTVEEVDVEID